MPDCLADCFERDSSNRRSLKFKPNGGLRCTVDGLETYPHDQNFDSNYIRHSTRFQSILSTPNPINTGILAPSANGPTHTAAAAATVTNPYPVAAYLEIEAKADLFIMPAVPYVAATAALELKVSIDGVNYSPLQNCGYQSITGNAAWTSGGVTAAWELPAGATVYTPQFVVDYTNYGGANAAFIRATTILYVYRIHAR